MQNSLPTPVPVQYTRSSKNPPSIPVLLLEVDIAKPIPCVVFIDLSNGQRYQHGLLLVRMYDDPVGFVELEVDEFQVEPRQVASIIWSTLSNKINMQLQAFGLPTIATLTPMGLPRRGKPAHIQQRQQLKESAPMMSVVVCTRNRPDKLVRCLQSLEMLDYPIFEIIVVDNAPNDDVTYKLVNSMFPDVHYVREEVEGLSHARNKGLATAIGEIVAFTDDDAIVDRNWLLEILRGFDRCDDVMCVTGLTLPAELETPSQIWFQRQRGQTEQFTRKVLDVQSAPLCAPAQLSRHSTGINMAFRRATLQKIGGFDTALGIGSKALSGEDLAACFQVARSGYQIAYEPGAIVYHDHRETYAELREQIYNHSVGVGACFTRLLLNNPRQALKLPVHMFRLIKQSLRKHTAPVKYPLSFRLIEVKGFLYGPVAYYLSRKRNTQTT